MSFTFTNNELVAFARGQINIGQELNERMPTQALRTYSSPTPPLDRFDRPSMTQARWDAYPLRVKYLSLKAANEANLAAMKKMEQFRQYLAGLSQQQAQVEWQALFNQAASMPGMTAVGGALEAMIPKTPSLATNYALQREYGNYQNLLAAQSAPSGLDKALKIVVPVALAVMTGGALASAAGIIGGTGAVGAGAGAGAGVGAGVTGAAGGGIATGVTTAMEQAAITAAAAAPGVAPASVATAAMQGASWATLSTGAVPTLAQSAVADVIQRAAQSQLRQQATNALKTAVAQPAASAIQQAASVAKTVAATVGGQASPLFSSMIDVATGLPVTQAAMAAGTGLLTQALAQQQGRKALTAGMNVQQLSNQTALAEQQRLADEKAKQQKNWLWAGALTALTAILSSAG